ncbi:MAG: class I SAM-dependent methyltransferase [Mariprofundales bacterium]|nr:class I SAM-dependent methyltransferase [Mariprofundales bacterium]
MKILDVGCGPNRAEGAVGLDHHPASDADVLADFGKEAFPFIDNSFDRVICSHVIEHMREPVKLMEEIWRVLKVDGIVEVKTPHYTHWTSWGDPTHYHHFGSHALRHFTEQSTVYYRCRYSLVSMSLRCHTLPARLLKTLLGAERFERSFAKFFPIREIIAVMRKESM